MYLKHNVVQMNLMPLETGAVATFQKRGYEEAPAGAASAFCIFICAAVIQVCALTKTYESVHS